MNILLITSFYPPPWGACAVRCYYFVKAFRERRWKVDVLVPVQPNRRESISIGDFGERIMRLRFYTIPRSMFFDAFSTIVGTLNLIRKLPEKKYDATVATVPPPDMALLAWQLTSLGFANRFITDIRDDVSSTLKEQFSYEGLFSIIQTSLSTTGLHFYHKALKSADAVSAVTPSLASYYSAMLGKNVKVIYNGAPFDLFSKLQQNIQREGHIPKGVLVADLDATYHGVDVIIKALHILCANGFKIYLTVVGDGRFRKYYEGLTKKLRLEDTVKFVGRISYTNLPAMLAQSDFGIVGRPDTLNWRLTVPTKTFEYIAAGIPVFAFGPKGSELERFINKHKLGVYLASYHPSDIAQGLKEFIGINFDRGNILKVALNFDRTYWAKRMADLVYSVAGGKLRT
jgi:glycosyltransferase involved in cell wall biosynthesis